MTKKGFTLADLISSKGALLLEKISGLGSGKEKNGKRSEEKEKKSIIENKKAETKPKSKEREARDLVIGFDLGTACTKVVIQDTSLRRAHAVPFLNEKGNHLGFIYPSELHVWPDGNFTLDKKDKTTAVRHLKLLLMEKPMTRHKIIREKSLEVGSLELTAAYVALVLRKAREWFMHEHGNIYDGINIRWHMNLGIPAKNYDDKEIMNNFKQMAWLALSVSNKKGPITVQRVIELGEQTKEEKSSPEIHPDDVNVIPEIAAQVAGYARSPLRTDGLHMLVDVGASTIDAATFYLNSKGGEDQYNFLTAKVERLGSLELHFYRLEQVKSCLEEWFKECKECFDMSGPIPETCKNYMPEEEKVSNLITEIDNAFMLQACKPLRGIIMDTKKNRDPNSTRWKEGLPIFLCGGGSLMEFYRAKMIGQVEGDLSKALNWSGFARTDIPKPENLLAEGLPARGYHRLSVAYGLSFLFEDIGQIVPPSEIDDIPLAKTNRDYDFISKEMV